MKNQPSSLRIVPSSFSFLPTFAYMNLWQLLQTKEGKMSSTTYPRILSEGARGAALAGRERLTRVVSSELSGRLVTTESTSSTKSAGGKKNETTKAFIPKK